MSNVTKSCRGPAEVRSRVELSIEALIDRIGAFPKPALLTGADGFGTASRYAILAARPRLIFEATGLRSRVIAMSAGAERVVGSSESDPLGRLADLLDRFGLARSTDTGDPDDPPFQGGLIGCIGYDLAPLLENLPRRLAAETSVPDLWFGLYDTFVICDRASQSAELAAVDLLDEGRRALERRRRLWMSALARRPTAPAPRRPLEPGRLRSNLTREEYVDRVIRVLEYLKAGDVFQVNLAQRFEAEGGFSGLDIFRRLRALSPAPYSAYLRGGAWEVASASPELFYRTDGERIVTRPIKGTRPRGADPAADARLAAELAKSLKDGAELAMIVDLERNDLGKVCKYGSIRVLDPGSVETFAQVHHRSAEIEGVLAAGAGPVDILAAMFPGGSITGAPKIRAMEIIDELETRRRGLYTGAIGWLGRNGKSAFNIAIRTVIVEPGGVHCHAGGGIVADSDPEREYEETLHKGQALAQAIVASGTEA